jgi:hypothetical protein
MDTPSIPDEVPGQGQSVTPGPRSYVTPPIPSAIAPLSALADARTAQRRWGLTDDLRRRVVACASELLGSANARERVAAMRTLAFLDNIDAKRERNDQQAATADKVSARETAARLLSTPEGRALCAAQAELLGAPPGQPLDCTPPTGGDILEHEKFVSPPFPFPYIAPPGQWFSERPTGPLATDGLDCLAVLAGVLGAAPEPLDAPPPDGAAGYTTRPPDATPPPAPLRRPTLAERRAGRRRR